MKELVTKCSRCVHYLSLQNFFQMVIVFSYDDDRSLVVPIEQTVSILNSFKLCVTMSLLMIIISHILRIASLFPFYSASSSRSKCLWLCFIYVRWQRNLFYYFRPTVFYQSVWSTERTTNLPTTSYHLASMLSYSPNSIRDHECFFVFFNYDLRS